MSVCLSVRSFVSLHDNYAEKTSLTKKDRNNHKKNIFGKKIKCDVGLMIDRNVAEKGTKPR